MRIDPGRTGLLVIDMQNTFCHPQGVLGRSGVNMTPLQGAIPRIRALLQAARAAGVRDFWSLQEHYAEDVTRGRRQIAAHTLKRVAIPALKGTWESELVEELAGCVDGRSEVFRKHRFGCFYGTRLEVLLRMHGINTLIVSGVNTNTCVETTLREAYMRDLDLLIPRDCVAGVNPRWHEVALEVWDRYLGRVTGSGELIAALETGADLVLAE